MTTNIKFPALEDVEAKLARIFDQAGPDLDLMKCEDLHGGFDKRVAQLRELNNESEHLRGVLGAATGGKAGRVSGSEPGDRKYGAAPGGLKGRDRLTKGQTVGQWLRDNRHVRDAGELSFDRYVKALYTGDCAGAEPEFKAAGEAPLTAGGHLVPTPLAGNVIDLARNRMQVMQAGAVTVPMTSQTLKVPRLTGEGTPGWHAEHGQINDADLSFDAVTFTAHTLTRLIKVSRELLEDSAPGADGVIAHSFAAQVALEVDRAALRGTGVAPEPRGVLNTTGIQTTTHGTNGAVIADYDFLLDAAGKVREANYEPSAHIYATRTQTSLSKLKEATTLAYLQPPAGLLPTLSTKQIPTNLTVGTSVDCSEIYTGDWAQLMIGMRTELRIEPLRERYADTGDVAFLAWLRADVQLAQPAAFVVDTGVRG